MAINYVNDLEARITWLESIIRENVPSIDLTAGPGHGLNGPRGHALKDSKAPVSLQENDHIRDEPLARFPVRLGSSQLAQGQTSVI